MARADDLKKQVFQVWQDVKRRVGGQSRKATAQLKRELARLRSERDRLLVRLGEQTLVWINQSPVPVPNVVKSTVGRLNEVVDRMKTVEHPPAVEVKHYKTEPHSKPAGESKAKKAPSKKKAPAKKTATKAKSPNKAPVNKAPVSKRALDD